MISTSWSMPDSPGKSGCPSISSAMTQPVDQTSAEVSGDVRYKKRGGGGDYLKAC